MSSRKKTSQPRRKPYQRRAAVKSSPFKWLVSGILIGLILPCIFFIKAQMHSQKSAPHRPVTPEMTKPTLASKPKKMAKSLTPKKTAKANYEFYDLLAAHDGATNTSAEKVSSETSSIQFLLDVSSFNTFVAADEFKAQLLLMGIDEVAITEGKGLHPTYKVTVGPFKSRAQATRVQKQLKENTIESTMVTG